MRIAKTAVFISSVLFLVGCAQTVAPTAMIKPNPAMMTPPCKLLPPSANADEDLSLDVQNAECTRQLRLRVFQLQDYIRNITNAN